MNNSHFNARWCRNGRKLLSNEGRHVLNKVLLKSQDPDLEEKRKNELAKIKREKKKFKGRIQEAIQKKKGKMLKKRV